jgi:peroxiredoxin
MAATQPGLQPGDTISTISLADQSRTLQTFDSLKGPNGLLILFNRSADWCPFCKSQLIDLEAARKHFEQKGIHVAAVTCDSPEILQSFALRRGIHYKLLADPESKLIDAFGIRDLEAAGDQAGIPTPNYFLIDAKGVISSRHAETGLSDRVTASYFYESVYGAGSAQPAPVATLEHTPHVRVELLQSDYAAAPGARVKLTVKINPGIGAHLYALGSDSLGYHSIKLILDPAPLYSALPVQYPKSTVLEYPQLQEKIPIYKTAISITQDVMAVRSAETIARFEMNPQLIIRGTLEYQACTNTTCFPPVRTPVQWSLDVKSGDLDSVRVPVGVRRK